MMMAWNRAKLQRALSRGKRTKGIPANRRIEKALVRVFVEQGLNAHKELWHELEPSLRAMLPQGGTVDASMIDAYAGAFRRFDNLDDVKLRATKIFETDAAHSRAKFSDLLRRSIGVSFNSLATTEADKKAVSDAIGFSVDRIKTINIEHFENFRETIRQGILDNTPFESLRAKVLEVTSEAAYPAWMVERVVVDQYLTAHAAIQETRQRSAGVTHYFWRTATDARVRPTHAANEGLRFAWDSPPIETGHPGTEIRCRCIADPDLSALLPASL